jgi:predicted glycosyltransferase
VAISTAPPSDAAGHHLQCVSGSVTWGADDNRRPLRAFLCSHDGFGLGHLHRNTLIAAGLREAHPALQATLVTGVAANPRWPELRGLGVLRMPPVLKDSTGAYRGQGMDAEDALGVRERLFRSAVAAGRPDLVLVDRHPYGTGGELRRGLELAAAQGAVLVLGLRDVLDEPEVVREELTGPAWDGVADLFDEVLVYGSPAFVDHEREYGLPLQPRYCGWVTVTAPSARRVPRTLAVAAGGGGDGADVVRLAVGLVRRRPGWTGVVAAGPYADGWEALPDDVTGRVRVASDVRGCAGLFASAEAVVAMAGYNSTFEALRAGSRPILVPRRWPRREQAIRASRLACWGLADVVDGGSSADEVDWLLDQPRTVTEEAVTRTGITFDGATRTAERLCALAAARRAA